MLSIGLLTHSKQLGGNKLSTLHFAVLFPLLFALIVPFLYKFIRRIHTGWFVLIVPLVLFGYFAGFLSQPLEHEPVIRSFPWIPDLGIDFTIYLDGLSLLFALIITGVGGLVVLYSIFYMSKEREALHNFYVYLLLFMGAMLGVVTSDNLLVLYTFWEMTSFSSFLLIAFWYQRKRSRYGATKSLLITVTGGFLMMLGFLLIYGATGTFSIRDIIAGANQLSEHPYFIPAMLLILFGAFAKSAQFPFHIWLPDAMEAPTPISAYLHSATMVKAGVYLVARLTPVFGGHWEWFWIITIVGLITLFWGSFMAIKQIDLKAMLAFSTISQLGLIMSLFGIGSLALLPNVDAKTSLLYSDAILAAIFHLVNHSVFKGSLFMVVGILDHELGTRDIRKLGGLMSFMPISFTLTVIGAFSMAGLPPFSGFLSKEMFLTGVITVFRDLEGWVILLPVVAWLASVLTFVYCMKLVFDTFTGPFKPDQLEKPPHEAPVGMLIPPAVLGILVVVLFFFPNVLADTLLEPGMQAVLPGLLEPGERFSIHIAAWHGLTPELFMTLGIVILGTYLYRIQSKWSRIYDQLPRKLDLNKAFDGSLKGMEAVSARLIGLYMNGDLRSYFLYIFVFTLLLLGGSLLGNGELLLDLASNSAVYLYEWMIGLLIIAAAIALLFSQHRLTLVIAISVIGYLVALLFVDFRAPDLALTQFVVETISTTIFLLAFYFLPEVKKQVTRIRFKAANAVVALAAGTVFTLIGLAAHGYRVFEPIASFYEQSYELAGAKNIVNAILVDFRGFDTMFEIVVLFSAGIGIYSLVHLKKVRRDDR